MSIEPTTRIRTPTRAIFSVYDDDGNMTQGYTKDGYVFTADYDAENRMTSVEYTDSSSVLHRQEFWDRLKKGYSSTLQLAKFTKNLTDYFQRSMCYNKSKADTCTIHRKRGNIV